MKVVANLYTRENNLVIFYRLFAVKNVIFTTAVLRLGGLLTALQQIK